MSFLGENIKIHFAGSDGQIGAYIALNRAKVHYRLFSCYRYIVNKNPSDNFQLPEKNILFEEMNYYDHIIQDSGLFTLMFGAQKGKKQTRQSLIDWQDKLIAFVQQNNLNVTCVEIDCQKILSVEDAWFLRERMRKLLKNRQINVFHFEDGKKGLDRLIEFSDYIAFSVPELRIIKPDTFREDVQRLVEYTKSKKPNIDIHLLGCTDFVMLGQNKICTSSDSTSWLQGVKYTTMHDGNSERNMKDIRKDLFKKRETEILLFAKEKNIELKEKSLENCVKASLCASMSKKRYENISGDQE